METLGWQTILIIWIYEEELKLSYVYELVLLRSPLEK